MLEEALAGDHGGQEHPHPPPPTHRMCDSPDPSGARVNVVVISVLVSVLVFSGAKIWGVSNSPLIGTARINVRIGSRISLWAKADKLSFTQRNITFLHLLGVNDCIMA